MLDTAKKPTRPIALDLQDIHKSYGSLEVLKGVSLTAYDGDVISILGSSGSGKSTLLRCINLLENPNQGRILIGNEELMLKPARSGELQAADVKQLESLRARVGFVFQDHHLLPQYSVLENVLIPTTPFRSGGHEAEARAAELVERVGLSHRADHRPAQLRAT